MSFFSDFFRLKFPINRWTLDRRMATDVLPLALWGDCIVDMNYLYTRSDRLISNVMHDITLPDGVLWKAVKMFSAFL